MDNAHYQTTCECTDEQPHLWYKECRRAALVVKRSRNYRSNKHGPHNKKSAESLRRLTASDRNDARQHIRDTKVRRHKHVNAKMRQLMQIIHVIGSNDPTVTELRTALCSVQTLGIDDDDIGFALFSHARQLSKRANVTLSKATQPCHVAERAMDIIDVVQRKAPPTRMSSQVHERVNDRARHMQRVGGLWLTAQRERNRLQEWCLRRPHCCAQQKRDSRKAAAEMHGEAQKAMWELVRQLAPRLPQKASNHERRGQTFVSGTRPSTCSPRGRGRKGEESDAGSDIDFFQYVEIMNQFKCSQGSCLKADVLAKPDTDYVRSSSQSASLELGSLIQSAFADASTRRPMQEEQQAALLHIKESCCEVERFLRTSLSVHFSEGWLSRQTQKERLTQLRVLEESTKSRTHQDALDAQCSLQYLRGLEEAPRHCDPASDFWAESSGLRKLRAMLPPEDSRDQERLAEKTRCRSELHELMCLKFAIDARLRRGPHKKSCIASDLCTLRGNGERLLTELRHLEAHRFDKQQRRTEDRSQETTLFQELVSEERRCLAELRACVEEWRSLGRHCREECAKKLRAACLGEVNPSTATTVPFFFDALRDIFFREHGASILRNLRQCFPRSKLELRPASIAIEVQTRFLEAWMNGAGQSLDICPAFHGTKSSNLPSIFANGFLVPGIGNSLKVVNGSAHGLGIYMAKVHAASLSASFAKVATGMLIGGVLDDAVPLTDPKQMLFRYVTAESKHVRHVGDAVVVFDPNRVVPFFKVCLHD